jgi:phage tail sheath protein FI
MAVVQELLRIAGNLNAFAPFDIPDNVGPRDAVDYQNAAGLYTSMQRIDNFRGGYFWNWFQSTNPFTGELEWVPPSVGYLYDVARVWNQYAPWFAAAGEQRGQIALAGTVRYTRVTSDVRDTFQEGTNCLNPILYYRGRQILLWGNRTAQRSTSKLSSISVVHLVNYVVRNMSILARKYVFDPNDDVLLDQLNVEFTGLLDQIQGRRGVESYSLVVDGTNNTSTTRNARTVVVDLAMVPVDVAEVIKINISINESGAVLNAVSGVGV